MHTTKTCTAHVLQEAQFKQEGYLVAYHNLNNHPAILILVFRDSVDAKLIAQFAQVKKIKFRGN